MKKILISLLIVSLIILVFYFFLNRLVKEDSKNPGSYIEFSSLHPDLSTPDLVEPDIRNILGNNISPSLDKLVSSIYTDNYHIFECNEEIGGGQVMILIAKYDGSMARSGYDKAYQAVKNWEKNAVAEIGNIIFPSLEGQTAGVNFAWFEPYDVNNPHITASRDFHKALFYIGETSYEMHYGWILNYIIFAPSQECLEATMIALYHDH